MENNFSKVMSERTDKQLAEIVTIKRNEYQPEALAAAQEEVERRRINVHTLYSSEEIIEYHAGRQVTKADMPFEWYHKALTVLLPVIIIVLVSCVFSLMEMPKALQILGFPVMLLAHFGIYRYFKDNGYLAMAKEFLHWIAYTLYIYIGLVIVLALFFFLFFLLTNSNCMMR